MYITKAYLKKKKKQPRFSWGFWILEDVNDWKSCIGHNDNNDIDDDYYDDDEKDKENDDSDIDYNPMKLEIRR